jgi:conjugative transfer signal peptidase TraF
MRRSGSRWAFRLGSPLAVLLAAWGAGLRVNLTGSLPVGLYRVVPGPVERGTLVLVCLPPTVAAFARARGYVPRGGTCPGGILPVGKLVVAIPGDTVRVTQRGLVVNGMPVPNSQPRPLDRHYRLLPQLARVSYLVAPDSLWVVSPYSPWSFDSRYFGPIAGNAVRARLRRLSVTGHGELQAVA